MQVGLLWLSSIIADLFLQGGIFIAARRYSVATFRRLSGCPTVTRQYNGEMYHHTINVQPIDSSVLTTKTN